MNSLYLAVALCSRLALSDVIDPDLQFFFGIETTSQRWSDSGEHIRVSLKYEDTYYECDIEGIGQDRAEVCQGSDALQHTGGLLSLLPDSVHVNLLTGTHSNTDKVLLNNIMFARSLDGTCLSLQPSDCGGSRGALDYNLETGNLETYETAVGYNLVDVASFGFNVVDQRWAGTAFDVKVFLLYNGYVFRCTLYGGVDRADTVTCDASNTEHVGNCESRKTEVLVENDSIDKLLVSDVFITRFDEDTLTQTIHTDNNCLSRQASDCSGQQVHSRFVWADMVSGDESNTETGCFTVDSASSAGAMGVNNDGGLFQDFSVMQEDNVLHVKVPQIAVGAICVLAVIFTVLNLAVLCKNYHYEQMRNDSKY